jgi:type IV pilus assembly protein PilO
VSRTDRNILILGLLIIVLVVVGYYFLLLSPLLGTLDARAQERSTKESELASLQQEVDQLEAAKRNAPETERQLLELAKRVPAHPEIPTLVVQIEDVADASGVSQLSIEPGTPGPPPGGGNYSVVPVTMSFEGTYEQMQDFLLRTRNLARLVTVNSVTYCRVVPLGTGEGTCEIEEVPTAGETTTLPEIEEQLQVEIAAEVYFQPSIEPSNVPAGTPPVAPAPPEETTAPEETTVAQ